jgi:hypothetical protein
MFGFSEAQEERKREIKCHRQGKGKKKEAMMKKKKRRKGRKKERISVTICK